MAGFTPPAPDDIITPAGDFVPPKVDEIIAPAHPWAQKVKSWFDLLEKSPADTLVEKFPKTMGAVSKAASTVAGDASQTVEQFTPEGMMNFPTRLANQFRATQVPDPFKAGVPLLKIPRSDATDTLGGIEHLGGDIFEGLTTPESIVTLPAAASSAFVKAAFGTMMAQQLPAQTRNAINTLKDPNATKAAKIEAVGNPVVGAVFTTALATLHGEAPASNIKPEQIESESPNASREPSATGLPEHEVRPQLGETPPLRQQGKTTPARPVEEQKEENVQPPAAGKVEPVSRPRPGLTPEEAAKQTGLRVTPWEMPVEGGTVKRWQVDYRPPDKPQSEWLSFYVPEGSSVKSIKARLDEKLAEFRSAAKPPSPTQPVQSKEPSPAAVAGKTPAAGMEKAVALGGATTKELQPVKSNAMATMNDRIDADRVARGQPPILKPLRAADTEQWDKAMAVVDNDPVAADKIMDDLERKPRAVTDIENHVLLHRRIDIANSLDMTAREMGRAFDAGLTEQVASLDVQRRQLSDLLGRVDETLRTAGTETGRALRARRMLANEDFTYAGLEATVRADNKGRPTTPKQGRSIKRFSEGITRAEKDAQAAQEKADQYLFDFLKDIPVKAIETIGQAQKLFAEASKAHRTLRGVIKGQPFNQQQIKVLWAYAKRFYIQQGEVKFNDIFRKIATDFGLDEGDVRKGLSQNAGAVKLLNDAYVKQYRARQLKQSAKSWVNSQRTPAAFRKLKQIPQGMFNLAVFGHGTTWIGTHAGQLLYDPTAYPALAANYAKMWKAAYSPASWEILAQDMVHRPNWGLARRAGLNNDPYVLQGDYDVPAMSKVGQAGIGRRGVVGLLSLRQDLFDQFWNNAPESGRTPDGARLIADMVNHATGTTRIKGVENIWSRSLLFAPRLISARFQWEITDPAKAIITKVFKGDSATPEEKMFANAVLKKRGIFIATMLGTLGANQALLLATGSKQRVNFTDPHKADWMRFKGFGVEAGPFSPGVALIRLMAQEFADVFHTSRNGRHLPIDQASSAGGDLLRFGWQMSSPFADISAEVAAQRDAFGRPLPASKIRTSLGNPPPPLSRSERLRGETPYTWTQFGMSHMPIPVANLGVALAQSFQSAGMPQKDSWYWTRLIATTGLRAATGVLVEPDPSVAQAAPHTSSMYVQ